MSKGLLESGDSLSLVRCIEMPAVALNGVRDREAGPDVPPNLTSDSTAFSKFPFSPFNTVVFRFSSVKPISRNFASFLSKSSTVLLETSIPAVAPNILDGLFLIGGEGDRCRSLDDSRWAVAAASLLALEDIGNIDDADLNPNLLLLPLLPFGGSGGGLSSDSVLPVLCLAGV